MWEEDYARRMQSLPFWSSSLWENGPVFLAIRILRTTISCQIITPDPFLPTIYAGILFCGIVF